jgi:HEAT repeat protein
MTAHGSAHDAAALRAALRDPDPDVRRRAARALDHLPLDNQTATALLELIREERIPKVRGAAVHVLACEGCKPEACQLDFDVVGLLIALLREDPSAEVRRQTIEGLRAAKHEPRVLEAIRAALNDPARKVRSKAVFLLPPDEWPAPSPA